MKTLIEIYLEQKYVSFVSVFIVFVGFLYTESFFGYYFSLLDIFVITINIYSLIVCN